MGHLLIYNPWAGHGHAKKILPEVKSYLKDIGLEFDILETHEQGEAITYVANADFSQYDGIISAGGDGTLYEVINGYYANKSEKRIPIGVLPVGTGNAFIRDMNLVQSEWKKALDIIKAGKLRKIDVGQYTSGDKTHYYLNILGLGFVADVGVTAKTLKIFGNFSYTLGVLWQVIFLKPYELTIEIDGKTFQRENIFVEISNTRYTADFLMAPNAKTDDGLLDVTLLNKASRLTLLSGLKKIMTGDHIYMDEVETFQAKSVKITTLPQKVLTPDGELLDSTPIEVSCLQHGVEMYWQ
jgi:diacylglycerol kinase (ATP)